MNLGVVTAQKYAMVLIRGYFELLPQDFKLIGCPEDAALVYWAGLSRPVDSFPLDADYLKAYGDVAPMKQIELIVAASEKVVVFWDAVDPKPARAIRIAMMEKRLLRINTPWGVLRP